MDAKREMGNSNLEIIIAKHEATVSNPEIRKKMMADGLDMGWLSIGLMGQWISGQVGGVVVIGVAIEPRDIDMKKASYRTHRYSYDACCGRGDRIRTCDHLVPNQERYRAALHPALSDSHLCDCKGTH